MTVWSALSGWKRYLLGISGALGMAGFFYPGGQNQPEPRLRAMPVEEHQTDPVFHENGLRSNPAESSERGDEVSGEGPWKDPLMRSYASRMGISFFVALLVGTLLRLFLRGMVTVIVLASIAAVALVHYGVIQPFWTEDSDFYRESAGWVKDQTLTVKEMVKSHAPSGFSAAAGLFLGIRR